MNEVLTVSLLPEQYKFPHSYCFFLHDILAGFIVEGEKFNIFEHSFEMKSKKDAEDFDGKSGEEISIWMMNNGYETEYRDAVRKHICVALLSDYCQFVCEALKASEKGKLTVTFALLRKPLKENLFYLEWLMADSSGFLDKFLAPIQPNSKHPLPLPTLLTKDERLKIIKTALEKSSMGAWISSDFVYDLRFEKKNQFGFEPLFQRANHLITSFTAQTEEQNFNFIFSGQEEKISQWDGLYSFLPFLLLHTVNIVKSLISSFDDGKLKDLDLLIVRANLGFLLLANDFHWGPETREGFNLQTINELFYKSFEDLSLPCMGCSNVIVPTEKDIFSFYADGLIECHNCGYKNVISVDEKVLFTNHLLQNKVICPKCNHIIEADSDCIALYQETGKLRCQKCGEEIEVLLKE